MISQQISSNSPNQPQTPRLSINERLSLIFQGLRDANTSFVFIEGVGLQMFTRLTDCTGTILGKAKAQDFFPDASQAASDLYTVLTIKGETRSEVVFIPKEGAAALNLEDKVTMQVLRQVNFDGIAPFLGKFSDADREQRVEDLRALLELSSPGLALRVVRNDEQIYRDSERLEQLEEIIRPEDPRVLRDGVSHWDRLMSDMSSR